MAFQRHVWSAFDFSEIGPELTYNDLRIVWLKMHSVPFKLSIRWILRKGLLIAQIGFQASNLVRNDPSEACLERLWMQCLLMQCEKGGLNMPGGPKTSETREGWLKLAWRSQNLKKVGLNKPGRVKASNRLS